MKLSVTLFLAFFLICAGCDKLPETKLSVMTFNIENGGAQVDFNKTIEAIRQSGADVVGIQEAWGNIPRLAHALDWKYYDARQHIISRLPLYEAKDSDGLYLYVEVSPGKFVAMANLHLPDEPYGPDLIKAGKSKAQIEENERIVRLPTALPFINKLSMLAKKGIPVFLTGDFNSSSHLDWPNVEWQVSKTLQVKGLVDSYRKILPDRVKYPGYTWPANRPLVKNTIDGFNPSSSYAQDRLDFIYMGGNASVVESHVVGEAGKKGVDISVSPWPSDHRAVVSTFVVKPASISKNQLSSVSELGNSIGKSAICVSPLRVKSGEPFTITWSNAPGNRYDYIRVAPHRSSKLAWGEAVRLYTFARTNGSLQYTAANVKGNWLAWHKGQEGRWPLKPGVYDVKLLLDDGYTVLAAVRMKVYANTKTA
jgi:endonuclease/exonuclease/phosphatase family metal-dependent hydrolase